MPMHVTGSLTNFVMQLYCSHIPFVGALFNLQTMGNPAEQSIALEMQFMNFFFISGHTMLPV